MKNYQNQLDRFSDIAKRLVDNHSADMFNLNRAAANGPTENAGAMYSNHLDKLGRELDEHAQQFLTSGQKAGENLKTDIWGICRKYLDQFVKRNQPKNEENY